MKLPTKEDEITKYGEANIDFTNLFKESDSYNAEKANEKVSIDFVGMNRKMFDSGRFDIPRCKKLVLTEFKVSDPDPNVGVWIHPNDPSLDEEFKPKQKSNPILPLVQHNPIPSAMQSELYRQQQKKMYEIGQQYIANRGPLTYQFSNPNGLMNLRHFQDDMNKQLNDPATVMQSIIPRPQQQSGPGFVPINHMSEEEFKDTHYEREKKEREQYAEKLKKNRDFGNPNKDVSNDSIPRRRLPYAEMVKRRNNVNTPTVMENFHTKSGDGLLHISSSPFTQSEQQTAFNKANSQYEEQKKAILNKTPIVYNYGQSAPQFYNPNDYTNYINNTYPNRPKYYSGYGYAGVSGLPDENGLPTVWYNDNGKYLIPTDDEIKGRNIPVIHTNIEGDNEIKQIPKKPKSDQWYIKVSMDDQMEDGTLIRKFYNSKDGSVRQVVYDKEFDSYEDYSSMGQDSIDQMTEDDTAKIATELSRYNVELADIFAWARNCIDYKQFLYLKRDCLDQLIEYRDNDPLCLYKSTVILSGSTIIVVKPKPATIEEINGIIDNLKSVEHSSMKLDNIYKRYLKDISNAKTLSDKLDIIRNSRDIEVIPKDKDSAYNKAKSIIDGIKDIKVRSNYDRYRMTKSISRNNYLKEKKGGIFEKDFAKWWNKPRVGLSKNKYEIMYGNRMNDLTIDKLYKLKDADYSIEVSRKAQMFNADWERLSEGRFHKPNMTFNDYIVAMNVTSWNIDKEETMKRQYEAWKTTKTDTSKCKQSIIDKVLDKNIENMGLSQVTKLPRYAPVSLSGIDKTLDTETRRQRFIERLLARQRRPMI